VLIWRVGAATPDVRRYGRQADPDRDVRCGHRLRADRPSAGRVRLSDATVEQRLPLPGHGRPEQTETAERLVGSPDGRPLRSSLSTEGCASWTLGTGQLVRELTGASRDLHALAFSPDGSRIVAADYASVLIWRTDGSELPERHEVHGGRVAAADWSADGKTLPPSAETVAWSCWT
jgi:WD40 repeat protein